MPTKTSEQTSARNQFALSLLFAKHAAGEWIYVPEWNTWGIWNGIRWVKDASGQVKVAVAAMIEHEIELAKKDGDSPRANWLNKELSNTGLRHIAELAQVELEGSAADFERAQMLFNCPNGTLDMRTRELMPHDKTNMQRLMSHVVYDPTADCPRWMEFLDEITGGDEPLAGYLQRVAGYSLTGITTEQCLFVLHGPGANGKSVFLAMLRAIMGDYGKTVRSETLLLGRSNQIPADLAALADVRYVEASETEINARIAEGLVKSVTGGEQITARFLRANFFTYTPRFKLFLATNHKPTIHGTDHGIWRRMKLIPFSHIVPINRRDKKLTKKLVKEINGILNWAVMGVEEWLTNGLAQPDTITKATDQYRYEMDPIAQFLDDVCTIKEGTNTPAGELYRRYCQWCEQEGHRKMHSVSFGLTIGEKGFTKNRSRSGFIYEGLELTDLFHQPPF